MLRLVSGVLLFSVAFGDSGLSNCGGFGKLTNSVGSFSSHTSYGSGKEYAASKLCTWLLQAPAGQRVKLTFPDGIDLEESPNCAADYITIYDGSSSSASEIGTWCGSGSLGPFVSAGTSLFVQFSADSTVHALGFNASYEFVLASSIKACTSLEFTCLSDKSCVPKSWVCDGLDDCDDGSDEENCRVPATVATKAPATTAASNVPLSNWDGSCGVSTYPPKAGNTRIVGGVEATRNSWPWQVMVRYKKSFVCGGTIISPEWIATAAHCLEDSSLAPSAWTVSLGKHSESKTDAGEMLVKIVKLVEHPNYDPYEIDNDVALFKMEKAIDFNDKIKPICLPSGDVADGTLCFATGWGETQGTGSETVLKQAALPIVNRDSCSNDLGGITDNMICAGYETGGHDACSGDSGGPLACQVNGRFVLQGITSWGDSEGCAGANSPGVYTRVPNYVSWIRETMAKN